MSYAIVDPVFLGRGPKNQIIPRITFENTQDNSYSNMKKGGKITVKTKAKKGKTKVTATATSNVTVNIGKKSRNVNTNPPRPTALQQIIPLFQSLLLQRPSLTYETEPRGISRLSGPVQPFTMHKMPDGHIMMDQPLPFRNQFIPVADNVDYEPSEPFEMKHEPEPDEPLMIFEEDLLAPKKLVGSEVPKIKVKRRTREEVDASNEDLAMQREEETNRQIDTLRLAIKEAKPDNPFIDNMRKSLAKILKKRLDAIPKK